MSHVVDTRTNSSSVQDVKNCEEFDFDFILRKEWEKAQSDGMFRYILHIRDSKVLEGKYQFLAQLNIDRGNNRRTPQDIISMKQSFDDKRFNFVKLTPQEEIMNLNSKDEEDIIAINASPIESYHSLLIPQRCKKLPQIVTKYSLHKALELFSLSSSLYLRVGFNSLCAYASVNHLHWHLYYLNCRMLLEYIDLREFVGPVETLQDYPAKGFCIRYSNMQNIDDFVNWAYLIISYLQNANIAHNVYITRATTNLGEEYKDLRMYIWARKSSIGAKCSTAFNVAICELFGHLSIKSREIYESLDEDYVIKALQDTTEDTFLAVLPEVKNLILRGLNIQHV